MEQQRSSGCPRPYSLCPSHRTDSESPKYRERDNATKGMGAAPNNGTEKGKEKKKKDYRMLETVKEVL